MIAKVDSSARTPSWLVGASTALAVFALGAQWAWLPFDLLRPGLVTNSRDFLIYSDGARTALAGRPLYTAPVGEDGFFTYPPFAALCFVPFTLLSAEAGGLSWSVLCFLLLALVIGRALRLAGLRPDARLALTSLAMAAAATALEPVRTTLWYGQINILLMALVFLDLSRPEGSRLRGFGVGVAAGVKLIPLIFLPYLLLTRQWRAAATAVGAFAAAIAISWAVLPQDSPQYWFHAVRDTSHIGDLFHPANQSINGFLARLWYPGHSPAWLWPLLAAVVVALGLRLSRLAHDRGEEPLALFVDGLTSCAVSPFTWGHHWVWLAPLIAWTAAQAVHGRSRQDRGWARWALAGAALYAWTFVWPWRKPPTTPEEPRVVPGIFYHFLDPGGPWYRHIASAWYVLAYFAVLAGTAAWLRAARPREEPARPGEEPAPLLPPAGGRYT